MTTRIYALLVMFSVCLNPFAQNAWPQEKLDKANTAASVESLTQVEKDVILYLNLARLFPKDFAAFELKDFPGTDRNVQSLKQKLNLNFTSKALTWNASLQAAAVCFTSEQGPTGRTGHKRMNCERGFNSECLSYGMFTGRDIVLQLLIDEGNPDLGHRKICLLGTMKEIGVSDGPHKSYNRMAVLDFY